MRADEAQLVLEKFNNQPVIIKSQAVTIARSTYAEMPMPDESPESPVVFLLFLSKITLTPQAIYNQFHTHGKILKVVIPRSNSTRALIQFENISEATNFIKTINGTYVTIGEYTSRLSALYSKFQDLTVSENNDKSCDFTLPLLQSSATATATAGTTGSLQQPPPSSSTQSLRSRRSPGVIGGERNIHNNNNISPTTTTTTNTDINNSTSSTPLKQQQSIHSNSSSPTTGNSTAQPQPNTSSSSSSSNLPQLNLYDNSNPTSIDQPPQLPLPPPSLPQTSNTTTTTTSSSSNNTSSSYPNHYSNSYSRYNNSFYHNNGYNNGYSYNNNRMSNNNNNNYSYNNNSNHSCVLLVHGFDPHFVNIQMLHTLFNNAGLVKCIKIHHSKEGYAFVQMSTLEEAEFAKNHFNLLDIDGKTLNVNYSKYNYIEGSEDKPQYFQIYHINNYTKRYPPSEPSLQLWCTSWTSNPDQNQLLNQFSRYGDVTNIKVTPHNDKYYVFVRYTHLAHATKAMLCLSGQTVCNSLHLRIMYSRSTAHH